MSKYGGVYMFPNIKAEMARYGLSQQGLADFLGVGRSTVKHWLNGETDIPASALVKMSQVWDVSTDYLLGINKAS